MTAFARRTVAGLGLSVSLLAPQVHAADDFPYADVWILWSGNDALVCAEGRADASATVVGAWTFTIVGARSDGTPIAPSQWFIDGPVLAEICESIPAGGAAQGFFSAQLTFSAVGTRHNVGIAGMVAEWNAMVGEHREVGYGPNHEPP